MYCYCCVLKTIARFDSSKQNSLNLTSKMSSIENELEKIYGSKNEDNPKRGLSTGGKILIGLSGK